jgi:carbamoyltransferase
MIVLGLIGRPDVPGCHDSAACLVIDGEVVGALEQERVSRRRYAPGEGPEGAIRTLLAAHNVNPSDVSAVGYGWADAAPNEGRAVARGLPCPSVASRRQTSAILPSLAGELGADEITFFDHHLCHAAQAYWLNSFPVADVLVYDGTGGDCSTSMFRVDEGRFELLERHPVASSLGIFYESAAAYAGLGPCAGGKLMGLSSYGRPSGRRFMTFDPGSGEFGYEPVVGRHPKETTYEMLVGWWMDRFERTVFPYTATSSNTFDYAGFAADVQATLEEVGLALATRLHALSGSPSLLLAGGVALNAQLNRRLAREGPYGKIAGTACPHDAGTAIGAALLLAAWAGEPVGTRAAAAPPPIFLGPLQQTYVIEAALKRRGVEAVAMDPGPLLRETSATLEADGVVAWFDGRCEFGPRALGARSLLASPRRREQLDRLNRIKGRAPWRPASLALSPQGFHDVEAEPPVTGLTEIMLCTHAVSASEKAPAGVHVDGTTRAQVVPDDTTGLGALLAAVRNQCGLPGLLNTSLNTGGEPMVSTPDQAIDLLLGSTEVDLLVMAPYVLRPRSPARGY